MRKPLDRTQEHQLASDLLCGIFKASVTLQAITGESFPRNGDIQRSMAALAKTLNALRRELHVEFASKASFDQQSPYANFEQRLQAPENKEPEARAAGAAPAGEQPLFGRI